MTTSVTDRFLRYVVIDTQSDAHSQTQPSTEKQKNLGRLLVEQPLMANVLADLCIESEAATATALRRPSVMPWPIDICRRSPGCSVRLALSPNTPASASRACVRTQSSTVTTGKSGP